LNANPLIAEDTPTSVPQSAKIFYGVYKAGEAYSRAFTQDFSFMDAGVATFSLSLDVLSFVSNPFKHLVQAGVSWLFEHISFLREPLDWVAGNPNAIQGLSLTWNNIAMELHEAADQWATEMESVADWDGLDAQAYRESAAGFEAVLRATAEGAVTTANGINIAGVAVAILRNAFLEIISNFIAEAIMWILGALATAGFTFGATVAAATARIVSKAVSVFANMVGKLGQLMSKFGRWIASFRKFGTESAGLKKVLDASTDKLLQGASKGFMGAGAKTMNAAGSMRNTASDTLLKSLDPLKNKWTNPVDKLKMVKYTANAANTGRNHHDKMQADRDANGGP
jgi:hypothetical protein